MRTKIDEINTEIQDLEKQIRMKEFERFQATGKAKSEDRLIRRARLRKLRYSTKNGLDVYKLRQAGHKVKVTHIRYTASDDISVLIPAPSYLRGVVEFYPRGGVTYLVITTADGQTLSANSICHADDCFDYKLGVKLCLDQISQAEADFLLSTLPAAPIGTALPVAEVEEAVTA